MSKHSNSSVYRHTNLPNYRLVHLLLKNLHSSLLYYLLTYLSTYLLAYLHGCLTVSTVHVRRNIKYKHIDTQTAPSLPLLRGLGRKGREK